jgi:hypothetical protein
MQTLDIFVLDRLRIVVGLVRLVLEVGLFVLDGVVMCARRCHQDSQRCERRP